MTKQSQILSTKDAVKLFNIIFGRPKICEQKRREASWKYQMSTVTCTLRKVYGRKSYGQHLHHCRYDHWHHSGCRLRPNGRRKSRRRHLLRPGRLRSGSRPWTGRYTSPKSHNLVLQIHLLTDETSKPWAKGTNTSLAHGPES